jgi:hypothetical protein
VHTGRAHWDTMIRQHGGDLLQSRQWETERLHVEEADGVGLAWILFRWRGPGSPTWQAIAPC